MEIELTIHKVGNENYRFFIPSIPSKELNFKRVVEGKVVYLVRNL